MVETAAVVMITKFRTQN